MILLVVPKILEETWLGESMQMWAIALGAFVATVTICRIVKGTLVSWAGRAAEKTSSQVDDAWVRAFEGVALYAYLAAGLAIVREIVGVSRAMQEAMGTTILVLLAVQVALWLQRGVSSFLDVWAEGQQSAHSATAAGATKFLGKLFIWTFLLLFVLSNIGVELTTIVAGLGVGGVAAALAVQALLSDLIAGLSMYFDRPFDLGDFIIVGDVMGNVAKIGVRTTRIDSLGGEKVVFPNGELASQYIRNFQRMDERRIVFQVGVEYGLSTSKLRLARDLAKEAVVANDQARFDRAHFKGFGAYSLDFEIVYYVLSPDYNVYMDTQHAINMAIYSSYEDNGIAFAFPTRTIYSRSDSRSAAPTE
jgi:small-conductance mechanosensitive channel